MPKLTTQHRFALTLSLYVFIFLIIAYGIFILFFDLKTQRDITDELSKNSQEIINNYLVFDRGKINFRIDETGLSLKAYLTTEGHPALFIDEKQNILRTYGLFAIEEKDHKDELQKLISLSDETQKKGKVREKTIVWENQEIKIKIVPLLYQKNIVGVLILGKSLSDLAEFKSVVLITFFVMTATSLIGSLLLGNFLSNMAFRPIVKIQHTIEDIDLDRLDKQVAIEGHPNDETVLLARKFNDMISRLHEASIRQKDFIANASHELKTPLARMISSIDVMFYGSKDIQKQDLQIIRNELFSLNELIEKLLLLAKLNANKHINSNPHKINPETMITSISEQLMSMLQSKQIILNKTLPRTFTVSIPSEYLKTILSNLLSNAIKYSPPNSSINIDFVENVKDSVIEVVDQGYGMNDEETKHIFDRFYRGNNQHKIKGFGIGLSLVKQIADIYNAKVVITSLKGRGTKVSLVMKIT